MQKQKGQMLEESTMNRQGPIKEFLPGPKSKSWNQCSNMILRRLLFQHDCQLLRLATFETSLHYCRQSDVSSDFCDQYQLIFLHCCCNLDANELINPTGGRQVKRGMQARSSSLNLSPGRSSPRWSQQNICLFRHASVSSTYPCKMSVRPSVRPLVRNTF